MDFRIDFFFDLKNIVFRIQNTNKLMQLIPRIHDLQHLLLHIHSLKNVGCDIEDFALNVFGIFEGEQHFARHVAVQVDIFRKQAGSMTKKSIKLGIHRHMLEVDPEFGFEEFSIRDEAFDCRLHNTIYQNLHQPIRQFQDLDDFGNRPFVVNILNAGFFGDRIFLRSEKNEFVAFKRLVHCLERGFPSDKNRKDHVREHDDIPQRKNGKLIGNGVNLIAVLKAAAAHGFCLH